jgi:hypothetical protein
MTPAGASPHRRLLAVIAPGEGPHLLAPTMAVYRSRRATPRVSLEDELATCLAFLDRDARRYERAAASWHARWCVELTTLTVAEIDLAMTLLRAIAGPRGIAAARTLRSLCLGHGQDAVAETLERYVAGHDGH